MLDKIIAEIGTTLGLGEAMPTIAKELLTVIFNPVSGGMTAFANKIKVTTGSDFSQYLTQFQDEYSRMPENDVIQVLGRETIARIASACSINNASVITSAAALLPAMLKTIAPSGVIPQGIPAVVSDFAPGLAKLSQLQNSSLSPEIINTIANLENNESSRATHSTVRHNSWFIPALVLATLAWFGWSWINKHSTQVAQKIQPLTTAPQTSAPQTIGQTADTTADRTEQEGIENDSIDSARAALAPQALSNSAINPGINRVKNISANLAIRNVSGKIVFSGTVADQDTRDSIIFSMKDIFGPNNITGDLIVDDRASTPNWIGKLSLVFSEIKINGLTITMSGDSIRIGGNLPRATLNSLMLKLKSVLGQGFSIAAELNAVE